VNQDYLENTNFGATHLYYNSHDKQSMGHFVATLKTSTIITDLYFRSLYGTDCDLSNLVPLGPDWSQMWEFSHPHSTSTSK
jgi:hypothetical protein